MKNKIQNERMHMDKLILDDDIGINFQSERYKSEDDNLMEMTPQSQKSNNPDEIEEEKDE